MSKFSLLSVESKWASIDIDQNDSHEAEKYSSIFYQPSVWELKLSKTVWLLKMSEQSLKSWDAALICILTVNLFKHHQCKKYVLTINMHLNNQRSKLRYEAVKIILHKIELQTDWGSDKCSLSVFLAEDLNSKLNQEAYKLLNDTGSYMRDLRNLILSENHYRHDDIFTEFKDKSERLKRINFVFLDKKKMSSSTTDEHKRIKIH